MLVHTKTYTSPPPSSYIYHHNASKKTWVGAGGVDVVCAGRFLYPVFIYSHSLGENCTTLFNRTRYQARPVSRLDYIVMVTHRLYPVKNTSGMFLSGLAVPVCMYWHVLTAPRKIRLYGTYAYPSLCSPVAMPALDWIMPCNTTRYKEDTSSRRIYRGVRQARRMSCDLCRVCRWEIWLFKLRPKRRESFKNNRGCVPQSVI